MVLGSHCLPLAYGHPIEAQRDSEPARDTYNPKKKFVDSLGEEGCVTE